MQTWARRATLVLTTVILIRLTVLTYQDGDYLHAMFLMFCLGGIFGVVAMTIILVIITNRARKK